MLAVVLRVLGLALGLAFNLVLARTLGAEGAGIYFLAFSAMTIAAGLGRFGLDNALLRFAAAQYHGGERHLLPGLYRTGMALALLGAGTTATLLLLGAPWLAADVFHQPELTWPLRWMALAVLPFTLLNLHAEFLKATDRLSAATLIQAIGVPALSALLLIAAAGFEPGPQDATLIYASACTAVLATACVLWYRAAPAPLWQGPAFDRRMLLAASLPLFCATAMQLVLSWSDTLLLGVWADSATVGGYHVAKRTAMLNSVFVVAVSSAVGPRFAALHAAGEHRELARLAHHTALLMVLYATPLATIFLFWPELVLRLFGEGFVAAAWPLRILGFGQFLVMLNGPANLLLVMSGHGAVLRNATALAAAVDLALNLALIPPFGAVGAAVAHAISALVLTTVVVLQAQRRLGIRTLSLRLRRGGDDAA